MLVIKEVNLAEGIPTELKNILDDLDKSNIKTIYQSEGMFNITDKDFLIVIKEEVIDEGLECFGYVYNGTEPNCSEFGYFGLNKDKTNRIW